MDENAVAAPVRYADIPGFSECRENREKPVRQALLDLLAGHGSANAARAAIGLPLLERDYFRTTGATTDDTR